MAYNKQYSKKKSEVDETWKFEPMVELSDHEVVQLVFWGDRVYLGERYRIGADKELKKKFVVKVSYVDGVKKPAPVTESRELKFPLGNNMLEAIQSLEFFKNELVKKYEAAYGKLPVSDSTA